MYSTHAHAGVWLRISLLLGIQFNDVDVCVRQREHFQYDLASEGPLPHAVKAFMASRPAQAYRLRELSNAGKVETAVWAAVVSGVGPVNQEA